VRDEHNRLVAQQPLDGVVKDMLAGVLVDGGEGVVQQDQVWGVAWSELVGWWAMISYAVSQGGESAIWKGPATHLLRGTPPARGTAAGAGRPTG
jgi:hypothetical protein